MTAGLVRRHWTSVFFIALLTPPGGSASADTTISTALTTGINTSTVNGGSPDNIIVSGGTGGSITVTGGAAITLDSNNSVTNGANITINNANSATGILILGGTTGSVVQGGDISIGDSTPATTIPLTGGVNRYGIDIVGGTGPFNGTITQNTSSPITILGNNSAGILIQAGGLNGNIFLSGTTGVTGNNSFGLQTTAPITGGITLYNGGAINALGTGSGGISLGSSVSGQLYINGTVTATGYYSPGVTSSNVQISAAGEITARPTNTLVINALNGLDYLQGGPAVAATGSIGGGILVDGGGTLVAYSSSPTILLAPTSGAAEIGVASSAPDAFGLLNRGSITANGIFDGFSANAIQVGGAGGTVTVDGGIKNTGTISSTAYSANATGISILSGASVPTLINTGTLSAYILGGYNANATVGGTATAVLVNGGALSNILNTGAITASTINGSTIALDLRGDTASTSSFTQASSGTSTAPSTVGDVYFSPTSTAAIDLQAGTINGSVVFGNGLANSLTIENGTSLKGGLSVASGGELALNVTNGQLTITNSTNVTLSSLNIGPSSQVVFGINGAANQSTNFTVIGATVISSTAKIGVDFETKLSAPETFTLIQPGSTSAGAIIGSLQPVLGSVPYLYAASLSTSATAGTISVSVRPRTFTEVGGLGNVAAFNATFASFDRDSSIRDAFNGATTQQGFTHLYNQTLPADYTGGLFQSLAQGTGAIVRAQEGNSVAMAGGHGGAWAQEFGFVSSDSSNNNAPGFDGGGVGLVFGWETRESEFGSLGVSFSYMRSAINNSSMDSDYSSGSVYGAGLYYREAPSDHGDGVYIMTSVNAGYAGLNTHREFNGTDFTGAAFNRTAVSAWSGALGQAHVGLAYEEKIDGNFFVRPETAFDYFALYSPAHNERDGGAGFDLNIASSTGKQGTAEGGLTVGTEFGDKSFIWRPEITMGWDQVFGGAATTVAQYSSGGASYSLSPQLLKGGPIARLALHGGNRYADLALEASAEEHGQYRSGDARVVARLRF